MTTAPLASEPRHRRHKVPRDLWPGGFYPLEDAMYALDQAIVNIFASRPETFGLAKFKFLSYFKGNFLSFRMWASTVSYFAGVIRWEPRPTAPPASRARSSTKIHASAPVTSVVPPLTIGSSDPGTRGALDRNRVVIR